MSHDADDFDKITATSPSQNDDGVREILLKLND